MLCVWAVPEENTATMRTAVAAIISQNATGTDLGGG